MDDIIQIKCPFDGAVLSVRNQPGIETKEVTCPVCRNRYPFTRFRRVMPLPQADGPKEATSYRVPATGTPAAGYPLGRLTVTETGVSRFLKPGRNVIGRRATQSAADFQIDTGADRAMSREHIVIEARKVAGRGFVHTVSLFKERVNKTFVGNEPLLFGDCVVLNHGDVIRLPGSTLKFEIPDEESTDYEV